VEKSDNLVKINSLSVERTYCMV